MTNAIIGYGPPARPGVPLRSGDFSGGKIRLWPGALKLWASWC